jgi:hypothetical protein
MFLFMGHTIASQVCCVKYINALAVVEEFVAEAVAAPPAVGDHVVQGDEPREVDVDLEVRPAGPGAELAAGEADG